ncbi:MAG: dUTP diphosphatase [Simkaniaceae bacterium]|nr:dUTP diphosphatase [Simkaniaceae bacterium]
MEEIEIPVLIDDESLLPTYGSEEAAGADVRANIEESIEIEPGEVKLIPTSVRMALPEGYEVQVRPRSGLALKHGITVLNTPGTIDSDYRGELCVILINHGDEPFEVTPKMRIAQIVVAPVLRARFEIHENLTATTRGENGFGHSGTH